MNETGLSPLAADRLTSWLIDEAGTARPGHLDEVLASLEHVRQRPAWSSPGRWLPMQLALNRFDVPRFVPYAILVTVLAVIALAAVLVAGRPRALPPPFGLAGAGALVLDADGELVRIDASTGDVETFGALPERQYGATWSRDGLRVAFWSGGPRVDDGSTTQAQLWIADADGSNARAIIGERTFATYELIPAVTWSPDSRQLAFSTSDSQLFVVNADGTDLRPIGDDTHGRCCPAWSPDGAWIAFNVGDREQGVSRPDTEKGLAVVRPDGSDEALVSDRVALPFADWSPDGSSMIYTDERGAVAVARREASGWTDRVVVDADPGTPNFFPRWSNAGDRFAYVRDSYLIVADANGSNRLLARTNDWVNIAWPCWSPDDRLLVAFHTDEPDAFVEYQDSASALIVDVAANRQIADVPIPRISGILSCSWQRLPSG